MGDGITLHRIVPDARTGAFGLDARASKFVGATYNGPWVDHVLFLEASSKRSPGCTFELPERWLYEKTSDWPPRS